MGMSIDNHDNLPRTTSELQKSEYESLRQELLQNERYVMERILAIIIAFSTAYIAVYKENEPVIYMLSFVFIIALWLNHMTVQRRVVNNARIVAYIMLVHEPHKPDPKIEWIGWENALAKYRKNREVVKNKLAKDPSLNRDSCDTSLFNDEIMKTQIISAIIINIALFYKAFIPIAGSENSPKVGPFSISMWIIIIVTVIASIFFVRDAWNSSKSPKIKNSISYQCEFWKKIFGI